MKTFNLLLIEDDQPLAELTQEYLNDFEFDVTWVETAEAAANAIEAQQFDLIICDVNLPDQQGFELITSLHLPINLPVIFLTALSDNDSQIKGLDSGACDYVVKPVEPILLLARIRAHIRHSNPAATNDTLEVADLHLDKIHKQAKFKDETLKLTNQEFDLLWYLVGKGDTVISRETMFREVIGREYDGIDRAADLRASRLRKKMEALGLPELTVDSIRNQGYVFNYWAQIR